MTSADAPGRRKRRFPWNGSALFQSKSHRKIVVYTALVGKKSILQEPEWIDDHIDYVCFTDQPGVPKPWRVRPVRYISDDPNRNAKQYKVLPHVFVPGYDLNIWIDANFRITRGFDEIIDAFMGPYDIVLFKHFERSCLYREAEVCARAGLDSVAVIRKQVQRYASEGFPENFGLTECNTILRRYTRKNRKLNELWWSEIRKGSRRDQLSFMYCVWKTRPKIKILEETARSGRYHVWLPHVDMGPLFPLE